MAKNTNPNQSPAGTGTQSASSDQPSVEVLQQRIKELEGQVAGGSEGNPDLAKLIAEKVTAGLTKEQATTVAKAQLAHDAALKAAAEKAKEEKK